MDFGLSTQALIVPAFLAGVLMFLAPCTLPLVPGYLAFISGVSLGKLQQTNTPAELRRHVLINGLYYVVGFSLVFMLLGSVFGAVGSFLGHQRVLLGRIGGVVIVFFGLYLLGLIKLPGLNQAYRWHLDRLLKPGQPGSSFLFGATFAFGWTPCIGPILASVLLLASQSASALSGAWLLLIFSLGMALPFLVLAWAIGSAAYYLHKLGPYLKIVNILGGGLLIFLGLLLITNKFAIWLQFAYRLFDFINYASLLKYL
jgi:cytochrome c-type biogenesis protein